MSTKLTRKDFLKKSIILSAGTIFAFSKFGKMKDAKAAVLDNTKENNISDSIIYTETQSSDDVFISGQTASRLAIAVNQLSSKLQSKIVYLTEAFNNALTLFKDTNIAKAINITSDNFPDAIDVLDDVLVYTKDGSEEYALDGNITITSVEDVKIPEGFYSAGLGLGKEDNPVISINKASLLSTDNLRNAGIRTVTDNGTYSTLKDDKSVYESIEVNIDENSEGIGNTIYNKGYDQATTDIFDAAKSITVTAEVDEIIVTPEEGTLLKEVIVEPQVHSETASTKSITSNTTTTVDLGENHNIRYLPIKVDITPSHSNTAMQALVTGTVYIYASKTGKAVITVGQQTNGMDLSPISIYGSGVVSMQQLGYVTVVNGTRISAYTYLLSVKPGPIYVTLGGSSYGATVANTVSYAEFA